MSSSETIQYSEFPENLPPAGTVIGQRFHLRRLLGQGGMSAVFLARDERLERDVAFKLMNPELALHRDIMARFVNEARMVARLDSPHVVRLLDAGVTRELGSEPLPYMVLELLHGDTLRADCERGPVEPKRVVAWMLQVCEGLAAAHSEGMIHRDLKPENLFLSLQPDGTETLKVLDFGVARSLGLAQPLTGSGEGLGSPGYMSPEQLRDASAADERSDIWSLGVVMYELLSGCAPFQADSTFELCALILEGGYPRLLDVRPDVPRDLAAIVSRCLARDPEDRLPSVVHLAEALAELTPSSGSAAVRRIRRRMHGAAMLQTPTSSAPTSEAVLPTVVDRREVASRRRRATRAVARLSIAAALALLGFEVAAQAQSSGHLSAAEATLSRWGDRMGAAAQDLLQERSRGTER
jgi:serine/threonine-protein kinase